MEKRRKSWITCVTSPTPIKSIPSRAERHTIWTSRNNCVEKTTNIGKTTRRENNGGDAYRFANVELAKLRSSLKDTNKKNLHMSLSCNNQTTLQRMRPCMKISCVPLPSQPRWGGVSLVRKIIKTWPSPFHPSYFDLVQVDRRYPVTLIVYFTKIYPYVYTALQPNKRHLNLLPNPFVHLANFNSVVGQSNLYRSCKSVTIVSSSALNSQVGRTCA